MSAILLEDAANYDTYLKTQIYPQLTNTHLINFNQTLRLLWVGMKTS